MPLSESTAENEIKRYQKHWHNKIKGLMGTIKDSLFSKPNSKINHDAVDMVDETQLALTSNSNHSTRFGYWTSNVVIMHEDQNIIKEAIKTLERYVEKKGFTIHVEDVNSLDAWLGSVPGHGSCNVRRVFINSYNLAHVLPLHSLWTGNSLSSPASLLPHNSPPVFYAKTTGHTPFRFHCDVGDVGHMLMVGPTGSGKSTFLQFLMAQFLRYENAKLFVFDNNYSHKALTYALDGEHYDIGNESDNEKNEKNEKSEKDEKSEKNKFNPLNNLTTESDQLRACQFIEHLVLLQGISLSPDIRQSIHEAISLLAENNQSNHRNLTVLLTMIQHSEVKKALQFYTVDGQFGLLDGLNDCFENKEENEKNKNKSLHTFEMNWLLAQKPEIYLPVLMHCFNHITRYIEKTKGKYPTLILLEESWKYINHPVFANQLLDWQKTLRKGNGRLVFVTTSLSDLYNPQTQSLTPLTASILESCPTKIYLPNLSMDESMQSLYSKMGLNIKQIDIIKNAEPKKEYYVVTPEGNRLIDLGFEKEDPILNIIGLSQEKSEIFVQMKKSEKFEKSEIKEEEVNHAN